MGRITITDFGRGLDVVSNPTLVKPGYARISRNLLHDRGDNRAKLRNGFTRQYYTRTANAPVYGLYEYISNAGTSTLLCQTNGTLESFTLALSGAKTTVDASHQSTGIPRFCQFLNFWLEADNRDNNYIGNGTAGYPLQIAAPSIAFTATAVADATAASFGSGLLEVGTYLYDYARYSSVTGEISPARGTSVSVTTTAGNQRVTLNASAISATEQFDQIYIYRTKVGGTKYYYVATITPANFDSGQTDATTDASLTTVSTIHTSAGASNTDRPAAASDVVYHRGRVHLVGLSGARSRHRWSQLNAFQFDSTTDARHDVDVDDGDFLTRAVSYDGTLVLFKEHSIHIMNGDVNELDFTWQVASDRNTGIGAYCPHTVVATPVGIIFQGECGVYLYRPGSSPKLISDTIQSDLDSLDYSRRNLFAAGFDQCNRAYLLSVTPDGVTTNTRTYAYFVDTGYWSDWRLGGLSAASWASMHSSSKIKPFFGDTIGYVYETDTSNGTDGVPSGTETGTATAGSATSITDSGAAFFTTSDDLLGLSATVISGTSDETQAISSNTGTALTTATFSTVVPAAGSTYYVGAIEGILSLGRINAGTAGYKRFTRLNFEFESQADGINLLLGFTVDGDTEPTTTTAVSTSGVFRRSIIVNRIGVGLSPYVKIIGVNHSFEILSIEVDYLDLPGRLP